MDGRDLANAMSAAFTAAIVIAFVVGGLCFLGGYWFVSWLWENVSISWGK